MFKSSTNTKVHWVALSVIQSFITNSTTVTDVFVTFCLQYQQGPIIPILGLQTEGCLPAKHGIRPHLLFLTQRIGYGPLEETEWGLKFFDFCILDYFNFLIASFNLQQRTIGFLVA